MPIPCSTVRGSYRYFTHKDHPEKFQYDETEIKSFNGFNIADFTELTKSEINEIKHKLLKYIRDNKILCYKQLIYKLYDLELFTELDIASKYAFFFREMTRSDGIPDIPMDPSTGEALSKAEFAERQKQWMREGCPESYTRDSSGNIITHEGVNSDD